jgi:predicted metal-binding protein
VYCNAVACSCNHCCYENATTHFLCIVDLHVAVNNMKLLTFAMETQEWAPFALLLIYKIFPTGVNNTYKVRSSCEMFLPDCNHIWRFLTNFHRILNIKLRENLFTDTCGWMDMMKQIYTFLLNMQNA